MNPRSNPVVAGLDAIGEHLAVFDELPAPVGVQACRHGQRLVTVQLCAGRVGADVVADLLAWADTLTDVTVRAWRPDNDRPVCHIDLFATLPNGTGIHIYAGATLTHLTGLGLDNLIAGERRPIPLNTMAAWAVDQPTAVAA